MCGADMCDLCPATAGVATSLSFMINPPSTNFRSFVVVRIVVVVRTGGRGSSNFACLVANPPEVIVCSLFFLFRCCFLFVWWG